jgi:hypothetical protein
VRKLARSPTAQNVFLNRYSERRQHASHASRNAIQKNYVLYIFPARVFSHSLGHSRPSRAGSKFGHVGLPLLAIDFRATPPSPIPTSPGSPATTCWRSGAWLKTLAPVSNKAPPSQLRWPLNHRIVMRGWNWLFFAPGTFKPDPHQNEAWNRGAYPVEGAAH